VSKMVSHARRQLFDDIYRGKTVLVTGHTGFKGSWLALWLHSLDAKVVGYALEPLTDPSMFNAIDLPTKITHIIGDVRDFGHLSAVMETHQPQIVFHLAAQPLVRLSYREPQLTYETNVMGTVNLLEAVRRTSSVRVVVNVTSDKCYENKEWDYSYRENDPLGGFDPYSSSKGCAELVSASYHRSFFNNPDSVHMASARAGNVVGGGDWASDRIVPDCIRSLQKSAQVVLRNPQAIRPWQHVLESLSGYLWLGNLLWVKGHAYSGPWNFGPEPGGNITVQEVVEKIIKHWGEGAWGKDADTSQQLHEAKYLKLDCTRANNLLKWFSVYDIEQTLRVTTAWYRAYYCSHAKMWEHSLRDIEEYVEAASVKKLAWVGKTL